MYERSPPSPNPLLRFRCRNGSQQLPACCLIFQTYPILITIQCRSSPHAGHWLGSQSLPAASSQCSRLSGVSRPVSQPARRGLELREGRKERRGEKKKQRFQSMVRFLYTSHQMTAAEILFPETPPSAETRGLERQTHPDTVKHTVSSSRRLN